MLALQRDDLLDDNYFKDKTMVSSSISILKEGNPIRSIPIWAMLPDDWIRKWISTSTSFLKQLVCRPDVVTTC